MNMAELQFPAFKVNDSFNLFVSSSHTPPPLLPLFRLLLLFDHLEDSAPQLRKVSFVMRLHCNILLFRRLLWQILNWGYLLYLS